MFFPSNPCTEHLRAKHGFDLIPPNSCFYKSRTSSKRSHRACSFCIWLNSLSIMFLRFIYVVFLGQAFCGHLLLFLSGKYLEIELLNFGVGVYLVL